VTAAIPAQPSSENLRGVAAMLAGMGAFVINDSAMKLASAELPIGQLIFMRGLLILPVLGVLAMASNALQTVRAFANRRVLLRSLTEVGAAILYLTALFRMPIADCSAILQFTPLAITAGAAIFLGAPVGWRRWLATLTGLIGVLVIVKPGATAFNPYAVVALLSVLFIAARDLITRTLHAHVPTLAIALTATTAVTVASLAIMPFETWAWPPTDAILLLAVSATAILCGQFWMIKAMRSGDIAVVSPFRYSIILWAIAAGYLVWREVPDLSSWLGIAIVTAAGLYTFLREQRLAKAARA
jgi:drug/metabolite transporter (DMT)-like permease